MLTKTPSRKTLPKLTSLLIIFLALKTEVLNL